MTRASHCSGVSSFGVSSLGVGSFDALMRSGCCWWLGVEEVGDPGHEEGEQDREEEQCLDELAPLLGAIPVGDDVGFHGWFGVVGLNRVGVEVGDELGAGDAEH